MSDTRAKKSGIGADIDKKLEARYDQEEAEGTPEKIKQWVNAVLAEDACPGHDQKTLHHSLMTGYNLCRLINTLLQSEGKPPVHFNKKAATMFVAYTNIENYNKGCLEYGLPKEFTVQSTDLWEGRKGPFLNVINNLHSLGMLAKSKGFGVEYTGEIKKTMEM